MRRLGAGRRRHVGRQEVLKRLAVAVLLASTALAQDDENDGIRRLQRLTVGVGDQFLGQVEPDGKSLIFVSNRFVATEIYRQDIEQGRERLLFDEGADVTWPRVSPDGRYLLYISFRERAGGQLCIRDLPEAGERRCLWDEASALQAEWLDANHLAVVVRPSIEGDLQLKRVTAGSKTLVSEPLADRNLTSPTFTPDGRWVVYVPTERAAPNVGPGFAARPASRLEALRLDVKDALPVPLDLALPGLTGQPVFSRDGQWLYVVQFFTDSNGDGAIDAADRGVLFRVPFPSGQNDAATFAAAALPEQLTSERWSCQYPSPGATALAATCMRSGSLDVYQLPLDGQVPSEWDNKRLNAELAMAGSRADRLLLYHQRLQRETRPRARRMVMLRLAQLHLDAENYEAAAFYAKHMRDVDEPGTEGLAEPLVTLVAHRKAVRARERGRMSDDDREAAAKRLASLNKPAQSPAATVLQHVVKSELAEAGGDFTTARSELEAAHEAISKAERTPRAVLEQYYERADGLYRQLDERDALVAAGRELSLNKVFEPDDQLDYARAAVRALMRGRTVAEADAAAVKALAEVPADSEYAFALELGRRLNAITVERPARELRDALLALYQAQTRHGRRQAVIQDGVEHAANLGADGVLEALATAYIEDVPRGTQEYRRAERLYRRALLGRAYRRMGRDRRDDAIADFDAVTKRTASLESALMSMNLRMRGDAGMEPDAAANAVKTDVADKRVPLEAFVRSYAVTRGLPKLEGSEHDAAARSAKDLLRKQWPQLKGRPEAQALYGAIQHETFLHTGDRAAAERANRYYRVALELSGNNVRYQAMLEGALGLLHTQVGNFYLALGSLEARDKLPYVDNGAGLAVSLARARSLLHVGRDADAAKAAEGALKMVAAKPRLERFLPLVHDRAALCNLAAGNFERAFELYEKLLPAVEASPRDAAGTRNRLVIRVARAAAALGAKKPEVALDELRHVDAALSEGKVAPWSHQTPEQTLQGYRLIASGLRANAELALERHEPAREALETRRALFAERVEQVKSDADLRALALAELRLAENAVERKDEAAAADWLGKALGHADQFVVNTKAELDISQLDVLLFAAQLDATGGTRMPFDLKVRLKQAHALVLKRPRGAFRPYLAWLEVYSVLAE
ncbi:MAG: PD40 domain-containing protein [Myxococcaceae bacterium]|nr:PD40 domain-containing protein [Myxococcaceae bacterium]